jgi:hypothetical protein
MPGRVADEVISHLAGLMGANVSVTMEVHAVVQEGVPEKVVRTVTEKLQDVKVPESGVRGVLIPYTTALIAPSRRFRQNLPTGRRSGCRGSNCSSVKLVSA